MVIAVANLCLQVDEASRSVRVALGSVAPTVVRATDAETFAAQAFEGAGLWDDSDPPLGSDAIERFGELVAEAASPIDDVRGTSAYRRHACRRDGATGALVGGRRSKGRPLMLVRANVNGEWREADVWEGSSLLYLLREHLGLPGSKNACEQGECGSCSVWLDGELVCACLVLAAQASEREVRTVEGLAAGDAMHPVQEAFVETGAVQCGFCTPGFVVAVADLLEQEPEPAEPLVREALSGNLCRCTGYEKILEAVRLASDRMRIREDEL